jgi:glycosyltransferase involved in cell wall biosynthesis
MENTIGILIPTFNREMYISDLLNSLLPQIKNLPIKLYIQDNCSTDRTEFVVREFALIFNNIIYSKNDFNVGMMVNFMYLIQKSKEEYLWLLGDDEIILEGGVKKLMDMLIHNPAYIVLNEQQNDLEFNSAKEYYDFYLKFNPNFLIANTLISSNIIKKCYFDFDIAQSKYATFYAQAYGMNGGLIRKNAQKIFVKPNNIFLIRQNRAKAINNDWHTCIEKEWINFIKFLAIENNSNYPNIKMLSFKLSWSFRNNVLKIYRNLKNLLPKIIIEKIKMLLVKVK